MLDSSLLGPFILTSLLVNITPGPDVLFVVSRSTQAGAKAGLAGVMGIALGAFLHSLFAALGLSLLLASSSSAFTIVKYIGAAYLAYLGAKSLWQRGSISETRQAMQTNSRSLFDGFLCNITNPKVALFMLAFLPQFTNPAQGSIGGQIFLLGAIFNVGGTIVNGAIAIFASSVAKALKGQLQKWLNKICGCLFIAFAVRLALTRH